MQVLMDPVQDVVDRVVGRFPPTYIKRAGLIVALIASVCVQARILVFRNPVLSVAAAFAALCVFPGFLLTTFLFGSSEFSWPQRLAVSSVLGVGLLSVPAVFLQVLHSSLEQLVGVSIGLNVGLALFFFGQKWWERRTLTFAQDRDRARIAPIPALVLILAVVLVLLFSGLYRGNPAHGDAWSYISRIRQFLDWPQLIGSDPRYADKTVEFRVMLEGWIAILALLGKVSQVEPIALYSVCLPPVLMVASLLAFYSLAEELFQDPNHAVLASLIQLLGLVASLRLGSDYEAGFMFLERIVDDKMTAWLVIAPVALALMLRYLRAGGRRRLAALGLGIVALALTHPVALPFYAICFCAFAAFHLVFTMTRQTLVRLVLVLALILLAMSVPLLGKRALGESGVTSMTYSEIIKNYPQEATSRRLKLLGNGRYMADPSILADNRLMVVALLLTPLLLWFLRKSIAAQFLFATTFVPLVLIYNPITAPLLGRLITPWLIRRVIWLPPVALTIGFFAAKCVTIVRRWLDNVPVVSRHRWLLDATPVVFVVLFALPFVGDIKTGVEAYQARKMREIVGEQRDVAVAVRERLTDDTVILAGRQEARVLTAYSTQANQVYKTFYLEGSDVDRFYSATFVEPAMIDFMRGQDVAYVVLETGSPLVQHVRLLPSMFSMAYRNDTYVLYRTMLRPEPNEVLVGAAHIVLGEWAQAVEAYEKAIHLDPNSLSAYWGLAQAYRALGRDEDALACYRVVAALRTDQDVAVDDLAAELDIDPMYVLGYLSAGEMYETPGRTDTAYSFLERMSVDGEVVAGAPEYVRRSAFVIDRRPRGVIFQHPTSQLSYSLELPPDARLEFDLGVAPGVWQLGQGDGVGFSVRLEDKAGTVYRLFSEYIDPKNVPDHRRWHHRTVDLGWWAEQRVTITLATDPGPNDDDRYDWAGWGEPRIVQPVAYDFLDHVPEAELGFGEPDWTRVTTQTINYDSRAILFQQPPSQLVYSYTLPLQPSLRFGIGMAPEIWSPDKGDGAEYNVYVRVLDDPEMLYRVFHRYIDPKNDPNDRCWFDEREDLGRFGGQSVEIIFETLPGPAGDANFDWGGWSTPVLVNESMSD